jgi:hypothetical protein
MRPMPLVRRRSEAFELVKAVGLSLPGVDAATKYDGSPVLRVRGVFMAGLAAHASAEPDSIVVRSTFEDRQWLLDDALRDLLAISRRLTLAKTRAGGG